MARNLTAEERKEVLKVRKEQGPEAATSLSQKIRGVEGPDLASALALAPQPELDLTADLEKEPEDKPELDEAVKEEPKKVEDKPSIPSQQQVKERTAITQVGEKASQLAKSNPLSAHETFWGNLGPQAAAVESTYKKETDRIAKAINEQLSKKQDAGSKKQWLMIAEKFGNALSQLGAGAYGLRHNVDLSGLKFEKTDWNDFMQGEFDDIDDEIEKRKEERGEAAETRVSDLGKLKQVRAEAIKRIEGKRKHNQLRELEGIRRKENARIKATQNAMKSEKFSQDQTNAATFSLRLNQAMEDMNRVEKEGFNRATATKGVMAKLPAWMRDDADNQQEQAERNFLSAVLRKESGAAISPSEMTNGEKQYFPRFGDGAKTLAQKKRNREAAFAGMKSAAGPAYKSAEAKYNELQSEDKKSDPKIQTYADKHFDGDYKKARQVLKQRGYTSE